MTLAGPLEDDGNDINMVIRPCLRRPSITRRIYTGLSDRLWWTWTIRIDLSALGD
jgi:hypothetical protein